MLNIALLQIAAAGWDQQANLVKGEAACRRARQLGADVALFPEMWNNGYQYFQPDDPTSYQAWLKTALAGDDPFITHFRRLAAELDMAIGLTCLERWPGAPRNTIHLIDRHGQSVLTYAKVHTCDFDIEGCLSPGDGFHVCDLDTAAGPVRIGAMICMDREFPESARVLMLQGAEIILVSNACEMERHRLGQLSARAYENMVGVALCNYPGRQAGHSIAFDGIAFADGDQQKDGTSRDMLIVEAGEAEGVYLAPFDLQALRAYRLVESWGNAWRKPQHYGLITSLEVHEPFIRYISSGRRYDEKARARKQGPVG